VLRSKGVTDEEMLARLLAASTPTAAAAVFARMGCKHAAAVLQLLAGKEKGAAAVAALLQCLSPVVATRCAICAVDTKITGQCEVRGTASNHCCVLGLSPTQRHQPAE
jgi:hypothetical protein